MDFKQKLSKMAGIGIEKLPSGYQIIGNVMLLKMPKINSLSEKKRVAESILKIFPYVKTACEISGIKGELRKPAIKKLAGESTETIHKENGILYKIDVSKLMFSKGNLSERKRLVAQLSQNEVIVDMFAGIGYFSLHLAKKARTIYAIEKNRTSFNYLKENIRLNKAENMQPILGDCRKIKIPEKADRVLMGYIPGTGKFLPYAFSFLKNQGIIHYHDIFGEEDLWEKPIGLLKREAEKSGYKIKILSKKKIKSYAPKVYHIAIDFQASR